MLKLIATTVDYCEHDEFYHEMHDFEINVDGDIMEQLYTFAKRDHASIVNVYEIKDGKWTELAEMYFKEFKCHCGEDDIGEPLVVDEEFESKFQQFLRDMKGE